VSAAWTVFWLALGGLALAGEMVALTVTHTGTLSSKIWAWLHIRPGKATLPQALRSWHTFLLAAFLIWLAGHLLGGWWT
jgi:hypothetical protein